MVKYFTTGMTPTFQSVIFGCSWALRGEVQAGKSYMMNLVANPCTRDNVVEDCLSFSSYI